MESWRLLSWSGSSALECEVLIDLLCSQKPSADIYFQQDEFRPYFFNIRFNITHLYLGLSSNIFTSRFSHFKFVCNSNLLYSYYISNILHYLITLIIQAPSKSYQNFVYYIQISNMTYLHNTSLKVVPLGSGTLLPTFIKLLEAFLETIFQYLCQCFCRVCSNFLGACESSFWNSF
jgi:hypothetical protein